MKRVHMLTKEEWPDTSHLVTEDDEPVDNPFQERQSKLLTDTLYASWSGVKFLAFANVGLFYSISQDPIVPDVMVSMGVDAIVDPTQPGEHRSYFSWEYGKVPDLVVEIVSNRKGGEDENKLHTYARIGVSYYLIYDRLHLLSSRSIRLFELRGGRYVECPKNVKIRSLGLGFTTQEGLYEGYPGHYLRFTDLSGKVLPTKQEVVELVRTQADEERRRADEASRRADDESRRADDESRRADEESRRADEESRRAERLAQRLRELGVDDL